MADNPRFWHLEYVDLFPDDGRPEWQRFRRVMRRYDSYREAISAMAGYFETYPDGCAKISSDQSISGRFGGMGF